LASPEERLTSPDTNSREPSRLVAIGLATLVVSILLAWPFVDVSLGGDHYVHLAEHFLRGDLTVDGLSPRYGDVVNWQGHKYLPFGPLPAVILIPFLPLLRIGLPLVVVGYLFSAFNVWTFLRILRHLEVTSAARIWATLLFFAGTPYLGITMVGISTYFAHVVTTTFLLLAILASVRGGRPGVVGLLVGAAAATRFTAAFSLPFFVWLVLNPDASEEQEGSMGRVVRLVIGLSVFLGLLAAYNWLRFGDARQTGFGLAVLYDEGLYAARDAGLFSLAHIPKNLFMMLLNGPHAVGGDGSPVLRFPYFEPSPWGMGLFFTSPALIYAFRASIRSRLVQASWMAIGVMLVPIVSYYGIGFVQFGYRYALDFMPFLALLAARGLPKPLTTTAVVLISAGVLINVWGSIFLAVWV
jgi:hypothetical protein